jgi:cytochrome P450
MVAIPEFARFAPETAEFYHRDDAAPIFRRLRAEDPVHWYEPARFWAVTRYSDIQLISQRPRLFSSEKGTQLFEAVRRARGEPIFGAPGSMNEMAMNAPSIIRMDPPRHNRHRKLVMAAFTPRRIAALEPRIREIAKRSLDAIDARGPVDYVEQIAIPMPMYVIAEMLGVSSDHYDDFRRWSDAMIEAGGGDVTLETAKVVGELVQYVLGVAERRRRDPQDDLISILIQAEVDGERLTDAEIGIFCLTLLVAGNETTRNLVSGGGLLLARHPEQREKLLADPGLLPNAIEEMLRVVSPVRNFARVATEDTTLRGKQVHAGDMLVLFYGSANRDEEVFGADSDAFDVTRGSARRQIAFGFGEHLCLGASLARLEARVMFEELFARWPRFALAGEPAPLPSILMNGLVHMPVVLEP